MKLYCVVYQSESCMHYRFRCSAKTKSEARAKCRESLGKVKIVEVYEEN